MDFWDRPKKASLADVLEQAQKASKRRCVPKWTKCPKGNVPNGHFCPKGNVPDGHGYKIVTKKQYL